MRVFCAALTYRPLVERLYAEGICREDQPYEVQQACQQTEAMGMSAGLASGFQELGHEVMLVFPDNIPQQRAWAQENDCYSLFASTDAEANSQASQPKRWGMGVWTWPCLVEQIRAFEPDLIVSDNLIVLGGAVLAAARGAYKKAVGFHCAPMFNNADHQAMVTGFDLLLAGSIPVQGWYRELGIDTQLLRYGFDTSNSKQLASAQGQRWGLSFVGQVGPDYYRERTRILEYLCRNLDVDLFASNMGSVARAPGLQRCQRRECWGSEALSIMAHSQMTLNIHEDGAGPYVGNMRLFEAAGTGCCLLTDRKNDLGTLFECEDPDGQELLTFDGPQECLDVAKRYLNQPNICAEIGRRAYRRIQTEHTYSHRATTLLEMLQ